MNLFFSHQMMSIIRKIKHAFCRLWNVQWLFWVSLHWASPLCGCCQCPFLLFYSQEFTDQSTYNLVCIFSLRLRHALYSDAVSTICLFQVVQFHSCFCYCKFTLFQLLLNVNYFRLKRDHSFFYCFSYQVFDLDIWLFNASSIRFFMEAIIRVSLTTISASWLSESLSSAWLSSVDLVDIFNLVFLSFDFGDFALFENFFEGILTMLIVLQLIFSWVGEVSDRSMLLQTGYVVRTKQVKQMSYSLKQYVDASAPVGYRIIELPLSSSTG